MSSMFLDCEPGVTTMDNEIYESLVAPPCLATPCLINGTVCDQRLCRTPCGKPLAFRGAFKPLRLRLAFAKLFL